jgi:Tol biopolymer transport system component
MTPRNFKISSYFLNTSGQKKHYIETDETKRRSPMRSAQKILCAFFLATLCLLFVFGNSPSQESAAEIFEKAFYYEDVQGDLQRAIELYEQILKQFPESREIAAKAQLHIGLCFEKLGKKEAGKAYERVITEFADQSEIAAEARTRLAALETSGSEAQLTKAESLVFKKIEIPGQKVSTHLVRLSPDGNKILCLDSLEKAGNYGLFVVDLLSDQKKLLVEGVTAQTYIFFDWSPDSKKIVYKHGRSELRIVSVDGSESNILWSSANPKDSIYSPDWSWDGKHILFVIVNAEESIGKMAVIASSGGEPRFVISRGYDEGDNYPQISPDGKSIVSQVKKDGSWDIYINTIDGEREIRLTEHPAVDSQPYWSPDGKFIVFMSDREKTEDLWAIPMQGIQPVGAPVRIKRNLGKNVRLTDFTASGALTMFMFQEGMSNDSYVLSVDPLSGEAKGRFSPFAKYPIPSSSNWSPDGSLLAYTSRKGDVRLPGIFISEGRDKDEREIPVPDYMVLNVEWTRDGQHLIFPGWDPERRLGIFRVCLKDLRIEALHLGDKYGQGFNGAFVNLRWLSQANVFSMEKLGKGNKIREVYQMDEDGQNIHLVTDKIVADRWTWPSPNGRYFVYQENMKNHKVWSLEENTHIATLTRFPEGKPLKWPVWSPDGLQVAFVNDKQLKVFSTQEKTSRVLVEAGENSELGVPWGCGQEWSPDGQLIAYVMQNNSYSSKPQFELWIVPASGGTPRKISDAPSSHPVLGGISWHPSGKMITVQGKIAESESRTFEHWALENFLPKK